MTLLRFAVVHVGYVLRTVYSVKETCPFCVGEPRRRAQDGLSTAIGSLFRSIPLLRSAVAVALHARQSTVHSCLENLDLVIRL